MGSCISLNNEPMPPKNEKKAAEDEKAKKTRIYRSDEDRGSYVAEPDIDEKAEIFINGFRKKNRVMDDEGRDHPQAGLPHDEFLKPL